MQYTKELFQEVVDQHALWLKDSRTGKRAHLVNSTVCSLTLNGVQLEQARFLNMDMSNLILTGANLVKFDAREVNFQDTDFTGADLTASILTKCDLGSTTFHNTVLAGAVITDVNVESARGIVMFGPVGGLHRMGFAIRHDTGPMIKLGCFWGTIHMALTAIKTKYVENSAYERIVAAAADVVMNQ